MIRCLAVLAAVAALTAPATADSCPPPSPSLLFHSCWAGGRASVVLLPDDLPLPEPEAPGRRVIVTGAYTGKDSRGEGVPNPVGLFIDGGRVINPDMARMDGILIVDPADGLPQLHHRTRVGLGATSFDLTVLDQRRAFVAEAAAHGLSVLQSHLLIVDGVVDVRPQEEAPVFVRRLLFTDEAGFGIYQGGTLETLHEAATRLARELAPRMALNLDMGSYDFCLTAEGGVERSCGSLGRADIGKLSNVLLLTAD